MRQQVWNGLYSSPYTHVHTIHGPACLFKECCSLCGVVTLQDAHDNEVSALCFSSDGNYMATGGADKVIKVWNWVPLQGQGSTLVVPNLRTCNTGTCIYVQSCTCSWLVQCELVLFFGVTQFLVEASIKTAWIGVESHMYTYMQICRFIEYELVQ